VEGQESSGEGINCPSRVEVYEDSRDGLLYYEDPEDEAQMNALAGLSDESDR